MFRRFLTALTVTGILTMAAGTLPTAAHAADAAAPVAAKSAFSDAQRSELNAIVKQYLLDNPQTLITSVESYYNKQNDTKKAQEGRVDQVPAGLYDSPGTPVGGNKNATFTIVEFFDYNCGYCKQVASDVERIIKEEKNLKFVYKELPILSDMSEVAARYALAANLQGKYVEYHNAIMDHQGPIDPTLLEQTGKDLGLDIIKLKKDADTQEVRDLLTKNVELARTLGIRGTPFFLIGKAKVPGAVGYSKMKEMIMKERDGVTAPVAATVEPATDTSSDSATTTTTTDTTSSFDRQPSDNQDVRSAVDDAKKEIGGQLDQLQKQALEMQKQAEALLAQQKALDAAKAKSAGAAAPAAAPAK